MTPCLAVAAALLNGLPAEAILVEGEAFDVEAHWYKLPTRAECAPGGLSGGKVLCSNKGDAVAATAVELPAGRWTVWARVYDWAGAPGHYGLTLAIEQDARELAHTEPLAGGYVWERWGEVGGGRAVRLRAVRPDGFNACLDCVLFVRDRNYVPPPGPRVEVTAAKLTGGLPGAPGGLDVSLRPTESADPQPKQIVVAVVQEETAETPRRVTWRSETPVDSETRAAWKPGATVVLPRVEVPALSHLWPGTYTVMLAVENTSLLRGVRVGGFTKGTGDMPRPVRAQVKEHRGGPTLFVDGVPQFVFAYLNHAGDRSRLYEQMAQIGVRFFTAGAGIGASSDGFDPSSCDQPYLQILRHQPEALIIPRVGVTAPRWWLEQHPAESVVFDDGTTGPQSMFSEAWLRDACQWIETYARYVRASPYADHVLGIHICSGVSAEWQSWGLWSDQRGDFSAPAVRAWRAYLRRKYGTDAELSRAWGRAASLTAVTAPSRQRRETPSPFLRQPPEWQDVIDFYDFYWRGTARAIEALARAAKRGGGQDWLVGFFYGYAIQYGGKMQESQHLGMRQVMDCPDIDFFCSPCMYSQRAPGGTSTFMSFTESLKLRHKLWLDEADNRTHLAKNRLSAAESLNETLDILKREFAHVVCRQAGVWWFDMQGGWYDAAEVLDLMRRMRVFGETNRSRWRPEAEVAVFIDDKSSYRVAPEAGFLHGGITQFLAEMPRLGAPYDTFVLADIARLPSPDRYRLLVFPLAFDLTADERTAIDRLKADGRTLLFIGPSGIGRCENGRVTHDPRFSRELTTVAPETQGWQSVDNGSWRLEWTPEPRPPSAKLRTIARAAGVHLFHDQNDALYAGEGLIALHAKAGGVKTIRFREARRVRELFADDAEPVVADHLTFPLDANQTRCFAVDVP